MQTFEEFLDEMNSRRVPPKPAEPTLPSTPPSQAPPMGGLTPQQLAAAQNVLQNGVEEPGLLERAVSGSKDLLSKAGQGLVNPSEWPEDIKNFLQGSAQGATAGIAGYLMPASKPDPNAWAGSVGHLAGSIPAFGKLAGAAKVLGKVPGLGILQQTLPAEVAASMAMAGTEAKLEGEPAVPAMVMGAAMPPAVRAVSAGLGKIGSKLFKKVPKAAEVPDVAVPTAASAEAGSAAKTPDLSGPGNPDTIVPPLPPSEDVVRSVADDIVPVGGRQVTSAAGQSLTEIGPQVKGKTSVSGHTVEGLRWYRDENGALTVRNPMELKSEPLPAPSETAPSPAGATPAEAPSGSAAPSPAPAAPAPPEAPAVAPTPAQLATEPNVAGGMKNAAQWAKKMLTNAYTLPDRLFRKDPAANSIREQMWRTDALDGSLKNQWGKAVKEEWQDLLNPAEREQWKQIVLANQNNPNIDAVFTQMTGEAAPRFIEATRNLNAISKAVYERAVANGMIDPGEAPYILNYLPKKYTRMVSNNRVEIAADDGWMRVGDYDAVLGRKPGFTKARNETLGESDLMKSMNADEIVGSMINSWARGLSTYEELVHGGLGRESAQTVGPKQVPWLAQKLNQIQDPNIKEAATTWIADKLGIARGAEWSNTPEFRNFSNQMRSLQFYHNIAWSALSAMVNATQPMLAASKVSFSSAGKALKMMLFNEPVMLPNGSQMPARTFATQILEASGSYKGAEDIVAKEFLPSVLPGPVSRGLGKVAHLGSRPFEVVEWANQWSTSLMGYLEALAQGKSYKDAVYAGRELNQYINKFGGAVNSPQAFRTPIGGLFGQFKSFQMGYWGIMKDFATDFTKGIGEVSRGNFREGLQKTMPLVKYLTFLGALGGPKIISEGIVEPGQQDTATAQLKTGWKHIIDSMPPAIQGGLTGFIGANLANQVGLGAIPGAQGVSDLMWFLPGPMLSHVLDAASFFTYVADRAGLNMHATPESATKAGSLLTFDFSKAGQGISPEQAASLLTRSVPIGGAQLDRLRKWVKASRSGGAEIEALNLLQAFGYELPPPSAARIREAPEPPPIDKMLGVPPELGQTRSMIFNPASRIEETEMANRERQLTSQYRAAVTEAARLRLSGDMSAYNHFLDAFYAAYGVRPLPTPGDIQRVQAQSIGTSRERMERIMPTLQRDQAREWETRRE